LNPSRGSRESKKRKEKNWAKKGGERKRGKKGENEEQRDGGTGTPEYMSPALAFPCPRAHVSKKEERGKEEEGLREGGRKRGGSDTV